MNEIRLWQFVILNFSHRADVSTNVPLKILKNRNVLCTLWERIFNDLDDTIYYIVRYIKNRYFTNAFSTVVI